MAAPGSRCSPGTDSADEACPAQGGFERGPTQIRNRHEIVATFELASCRERERMFCVAQDRSSAWARAARRSDAPGLHVKFPGLIC